MWPFSNSSTPSSSKSVAADLTPPPGPSTQAPSPLAQAQTQAFPTQTHTTSAGRMNIPSGNSPISPVVIDTEQDRTSGDKWTDYKAAFEVSSVLLLPIVVSGRY
jgi:hypothetical protein